MIGFNLDDVNEGPLRNAAIELGIKEAPQLNKPELIAAIKQAVSPTRPLQLVVPARDTKWRQPAILVSILALFVSALSALGTWYGNAAAVGKITREIDDSVREEWQEVRVYEILVTGTSSADKWTGLTFDEIKSRYTESVVAEQQVKLDKRDMQPDELRRILQRLMARGLVHLTTESKFLLDRRVANSWDCVRRPATEATEKAITKALSEEPGKYSVEKLYPKVSDNGKLQADDFYSTLNCMKSRGLVVVDPNGNLWTALQEPVVAVPVPRPMPAAPPPKQ